MTIDEMKEDWDWKEVFKYTGDGNVTPVHGYEGNLSGFGFDDVESVIASENGENDGPSWIAVLRLKDGRVAFVEAGCDYTGWG